MKKCVLYIMGCLGLACLMAIACCGCYTNVHVRDTASRPVEGATVVVQRYSVSPSQSFTTDAAGRAKVPWGAPGIETISAAKEGCGAGSCSPRLEPYIVVLVPTMAVPVPQKLVAEILKRTDHTITFEGYEGHGDPATATYVLDGHRIGQGASGWEALKYAITQMPKGSRLSIGSYYGGGGFPFREADLIEHAGKYGVLVGVPAK